MRGMRIVINARLNKLLPRRALVIATRGRKGMAGQILTRMEPGMKFPGWDRYGSRLLRLRQRSIPTVMEAGCGIRQQATFGHRGTRGGGRHFAAENGLIGTDLVGAGCPRRAAATADGVLAAALWSTSGILRRVTIFIRCPDMIQVACIQLLPLGPGARLQTSLSSSKVPALSR